MIKVRAATIDDFESAAVAYTAAWRHGFAEMFSVATFMRDDFDRARHDELRDLMRDEAVRTTVVEVDSRVVGFSGVTTDQMVPSLDDVWVHPHAWGTGAAPALVTSVEDHHRSIGTRRITTWVPEDSPRARGLFDKLGWSPTGSVEAMGVYPAEPNRLFEYERILL